MIELLFDVYGDECIDLHLDYKDESRLLWKKRVIELSMMFMVMNVLFYILSLSRKVNQPLDDLKVDRIKLTIEVEFVD